MDKNILIRQHLNIVRDKGAGVLPFYFAVCTDNGYLAFVLTDEAMRDGSIPGEGGACNNAQA